MNKKENFKPLACIARCLHELDIYLLRLLGGKVAGHVGGATHGRSLLSKSKQLFHIFVPHSLLKSQVFPFLLTNPKIRSKQLVTAWENGPRSRRDDGEENLRRRRRCRWRRRWRWCRRNRQRRDEEWSPENGLCGGKGGRFGESLLLALPHDRFDSVSRFENRRCLFFFFASTDKKLRRRERTETSRSF